MYSLPEVQRRMQARLLVGGDALACPEIADDGLGAAARLQVYRNNVMSNLTGALRLCFPATERLVGPDFFDAAAAGFIVSEPPSGADLHEYGGSFPRFLADFGAARALGYLADVARLEWAVHHALHAPPAPPLSAQALAAIPAERHPDLCFTPHPSLSLLALDHPALSVWEAVLTEDAGERAIRLAAIDLAGAGDRLAVLCPDQTLAVLRLSPPALALAGALADGRPLADTLDRVPAADAPHLLAGFLARGFFGAPGQREWQPG